MIFFVEDFPGDLDGKGSACNVGDWGLIPRSGISPGEGMTIHSSILVKLCDISYLKQSLFTIQCIQIRSVLNLWLSKFLWAKFMNILRINKRKVFI